MHCGIISGQVGNNNGIPTTAMAAYGKDAFFYGNDLDEMSEIEDNLNDLDAYEDEDDEEVAFCLCGSPNDEEMIMCESEKCVGCIWYHYRCAGFVNGNVPAEEVVWICCACRASTCSSADDQSSTAPPPTAASTSTSTDKTTAKPPKRQKKKLTVPPTRYTCDDAIQDGQRHLQDSLTKATTNPIFKLSATGRFIIYIAQSLLLIPGAVLQPLVAVIATTLYQCAGQTAAVTSQEREKIWNRFHLCAIDQSLAELWSSLFERMSIQRNLDCERKFTQNILKNWFAQLLTDRNNKDFPASDDTITPDPISNNEQCIIRYVAGFVAFKLKRFYSRFPANKTAQHIVGIVSDWKATEGGNTANFLSYSTKWIDLTDRGGLFHVTDSVFCFFRQLEEKARPFVNKSYVNAHHNINLRAILQSALMNSTPIKTAWHGITRDFNERDILFKKVVDIFIDLRIRAYVKAVCYQNRERVSKKKQKALRQDLSGD